MKQWFKGFIYFSFISKHVIPKNIDRIRSYSKDTCASVYESFEYVLVQLLCNMHVFGSLNIYIRFFLRFLQNCYYETHSKSQCSKSVVFNLGYAYPRGYAKTS
jgi:hypothetical protein